LDKGIAQGGPSPQLRQALVNELNRLLPCPDLYSKVRFASVPLPDDVRKGLLPLPHGDMLIRLNRTLLEAAYPQELAKRPTYPYRPAWPLTLGCVLAITGLVAWALRQQRQEPGGVAMPHPWRYGLTFTLVFAGLGFAVPGLVENGLHLPAVILGGLWFTFAAILVRTLRRMDGLPGRVWLRGLWALGVLTPWSFFAILLGIVVQIQGAKSFAGMTVVALAFGIGILVLASKWRRRLALESMGVAARAGKPGPDVTTSPSADN
jgi:hypothetical protein